MTWQNSKHEGNAMAKEKLTQLDLFDIMYPPFKFSTDKPIKLFEAFAGIGCQRMALNKLVGKDKVESVGISEIDQFALNSYEAIHGDLKNYGDIAKISGGGLPEIDILTWSFPCQDLSVAGKLGGLKNTRSGLGFQVVRILSEMKKKPKVLIMENVTNLLSYRFKRGWNILYNEIEKLGYTNYVETLNAKDYGVAQNRDRVFMVSILGKYTYTYPKKIRLKKKLKDYLEANVDDKYYLSDKQIAKIQNSGFMQEKSRIHNPNGIIGTLLARDYKDPKCVDLSLIIPEATKQGYAFAQDGDGVYINRPHQKRGVVQKGMIQTIKTSGADVGVVVKDNRNLKEKLADDLIKSGIVKGGEVINHSYTTSKNRPDLKDFIETDSGIMPTLTTRPDTLGVVVVDAGGDIGVVVNEKERLRIRKLTPRETWRLMGISDECYEKAAAVNSNAQLYKQAGNGIVVDVLYHILKQLI